MRVFVVLIAVWLGTSPAWAGPPFVTDDPEPVDEGHIEINIAAIGLVQKQGTAEPAPMVDANWGALPDIQLHVGFGLAYAEHEGTIQAGYGDTEIGVKYRFIDQDPDGWRPEIALYPQVELPTGDAARGLGAGHTQLLLPIWLQKDWGEWTAFGGGGFWENHHDADRNNWQFGVALLRKVSDNLQIGGEIYHQTATTVGLVSTTGANIGGTWDLSDTGHILFSVGRGLVHAELNDRASFYLGYQFTR